MAKLLKLFLSVFAAMLSGILLYLAFPAYDLHFFAWVGLVPLFLVIYWNKPWQAFLLCVLEGFVFSLGMTPIKFISTASIPAGILACIYVSMFYGLFGLFLSVFVRRMGVPLLIAAPIWVAFEYARANFFFLAFSGGLLGHTQYMNLPLLQMASLTGVYGISFILVLANAAIADLLIHWIRKIRKTQTLGFYIPGLNPIYGGIVVLIIILVLWGAGWRVIPGELPGKPFSVAVVQGNIPQEIKWERQYREHIISRYEVLSEEASRTKPQLIIWPEASTPGLVLNDSGLLQRMVSMIRHMHTYFLVGSAEYPKFATTLPKDKRTRSGNTALFFSPEGKVLGQYVKIRLVPFGEYIPSEEVIPWPDFIVPKKKTNFHISGNELTLFGIDGTRFGTLICWEILFPELTRSFVKKGANFVVNLSNEAWFGKSPVPYQILCISVFRAVENRINVVRSTNTGISGFIDPYGRIIGKVTNGGEDISVAGTLTKDIFLSPPGTFYTNHGDILPFGCIAFTIGLIFWGTFKISSSRSNKDQEHGSKRDK
jgi:apolipoprotein N-acyltransferase